MSLTPSQTPASTALQPTATPIAEDLTTTPLATNPTPSLTPSAEDTTATPVEHEITLTPTLESPDATPTPTGTITVTLTITPTFAVGTPEATLPPTPTSTPAVDPVEIGASHASDEIVLKIDPRRYSAAIQTLRDLGINPAQDVSEIETLDTLVIQVPPEQLNTILALLQSSAPTEKEE